MSSVTLKGVDKTYPKGIQVLDDFSLEILDQEFLVLVGPSGCGKSTILRIVAGLEDVTGGEVWIGDRQVTNMPPRDRDVAMVFQNYALYPHMTAYDNIAFGLKLRRRSRQEIDTAVRDAARILSIEALLEKMPKALSGGERQRVALGRAIVRHPQVFLFDEPLSNLDAKLRSEMRAEISALHRRLKVTTLYVTHDQVEAMTMGERIVVLDKGVIQQIGEPISVYRKPDNRFVAGFIGNPSMNFFEASLGGNGSLRVGGRDLSLPEPVREVLGSRSGGEITLGIRPEDVHHDPKGEIAGSVTLVEPTGGEVYVYSDTEGGPLIARASVDTRLRLGDNAAFRFDLAAAHFFDRDTEERIG